MKNFDPQLGAVGEQEHALQQLRYWLHYEGLTGLLGGTVFWLPVGLVVTVLMLLAAVFTPYMLWRLVTAKW